MDANTLTLPQSLDIAYVAEFQPQLTSFLSQSVDKQEQLIVIDASELERIDTAGIQLLIAFVLELTKMNVSIQWQSISSELDTAAKELGVVETLKLN